MAGVKLIKDSLLQLFFPHVCAGCGNDALPVSSHICIKCMHNLPVTGFEKQKNNTIEKLLTGRVPAEKASAQLYFTKSSLVQNLMHQFKYRNNKELGHQLGLIMGNQLLDSGRFDNIEALIPLPLHENKLRKRGYNQSEILCNGISEILKAPVINDAVIRNIETETQTKKHRAERWQNMEGKFALLHPEKIENKQILLVDDVLTTGATIDACSQALLSAKGVTLNIVTLCYASNI